MPRSVWLGDPHGFPSEDLRLLPSPISRNALGNTGPVIDGVSDPQVILLESSSSPASSPHPQSSTPRPRRTVCVALPPGADITQRPFACPSRLLKCTWHCQSRASTGPRFSLLRAGIQAGAQHPSLSSKPKTALQENSSGSAPGQPVKSGCWSLRGSHRSFLLIKQIFFQTGLGFRYRRWPQLLARHWTCALRNSTDQGTDRALGATEKTCLQSRGV